MNKMLLIAVSAIGIVSLPVPGMSDTTHLGVDDERMVHLRFSSSVVANGTVCNAGNGPFLEVRSSGTTSNNEYLVPAGAELVITDITWSALPDGATWSGENYQAAVFTYLDDGQFNARAIVLPPVPQPSGGSSAMGSHFQLTAGARIASRRHLCANVRSIFALGVDNGQLRNMDIYGYLVIKRF